MTALARWLGVSERHLRRLMVDETGIAPRHFARIQRFHALLRASDLAPRPLWAALAAHFRFSLDKPFGELPQKVRDTVLNGSPEPIHLEVLKLYLQRLELLDELGLGLPLVFQGHLIFALANLQGRFGCVLRSLGHKPAAEELRIPIKFLLGVFKVGFALQDPRLCGLRIGPGLFEFLLHAVCL